METKPKIDFRLDREALPQRLYDGLEKPHPYHLTNEIIARQLLDMMKEKTEMYGGNKDLGTLFEQATRAYYEGVGRKANRIPMLLKRIAIDEGDEAALAELVDTYLDIAGYAIIALNDISGYVK